MALTVLYFALNFLHFESGHDCLVFRQRFCNCRGPIARYRSGRVLGLELRVWVPGCRGEGFCTHGIGCKCNASPPRHFSPHTLHHTPDIHTLRPAPYSLHPTPYTVHPKPYTLNPTPYTLHPTPYSLHPDPCRPPNPEPLTAHSEPCPLNLKQ